MWTYILIILIILVALFLLYPVVRKAYRSQRDFAEMRRTVHNERNSFSFLINNKLKVLETNFFLLNEGFADEKEQPKMLGNVLHCQNGIDTGTCGISLNCSTCPIRVVINNAFKQKRDFNDVVATMHLYDAHHKLHTVDVKVDGYLKQLGYHPYMLLKVKDVTMPGKE